MPPPSSEPHLDLHQLLLRVHSVYPDRVRVQLHDPPRQGLPDGPLPLPRRAFGDTPAPKAGDLYLAYVDLHALSATGILHAQDFTPLDLPAPPAPTGSGLPPTLHSVLMAAMALHRATPGRPPALTDHARACELELGALGRAHLEQRPACNTFRSSLWHLSRLLAALGSELHGSEAECRAALEHAMHAADLHPSWHALSRVPDDELYETTLLRAITRVQQLYAPPHDDSGAGAGERQTQLIGASSALARALRAADLPLDADLTALLGL